MTGERDHNEISEQAQKRDREQIDRENEMARDLGADNVETPQQRQREERKVEQRTEPEKREIPIGSKSGSKRNDIYARHREVREAESESSFDEGDRSRHIFGTDVETPREERQREEVERRRAAGEADPEIDQPETRRHRLNVHGREYDLPEAEVLALAQRAAASDSILEQAKAMRDEMQQSLADLKKHASGSTDDPENPPADHQENPPDDQELDDIIDQIQVGSPEEAKKALSKYGDNLIARMEERSGNLDQRVEDILREKEQNRTRQEEMRETLTEFGTEYPAFTESPELQQALATGAQNVMLEKMHEIGVQEETIESIQQQRNYSRPQAVAWAYRYLLDTGTPEQKEKLGNNREVLKTAASRIYDRLGIKPTQQQRTEPHDLSERQERKERLGPQPRRATAMPGTSARERSRDETRREAVSQMRRSRRPGA